MTKCNLCGSGASKKMYVFNYSAFRINAPFNVVQCKNCGFIYNSPRLSEEKLCALYNKEYYVFDEARDQYYWENAIYDYLTKIKRFEDSSKNKILEIGCSKGFLLKIAKDNGWEVCGVEISPYASKYARETFGLNVVTGTFERAQLGNKKFDLIIALDLIEHVVSPKDLVRTCMTKLKNDGVLILETPNFGSIYRRITKRNWVGFNPFHIYYFTPRTLSEMAENCGFRISRLETSNEKFLKKKYFQSYIKSYVRGLLLPADFLRTNENFSVDKSIKSNPRKIVNNSKKTVFNPLLDSIIKFTSPLVEKALLADQLVVHLIKK